MSHCYKLLAVTILVLLTIGSCFHSGYNAFAQTEQTASKLEKASVAIKQAFNAILDAEIAGANVTALLDQLNNAATIFAQAENTKRAGNSTAAEVQADSVLPIAEEVTTLAQDAKQTALVSGQNAVWSTIAFTIIAGFVFVVSPRRHVRGVLRPHHDIVEVVVHSGGAMRVAV